MFSLFLPLNLGTPMKSIPPSDIIIADRQREQFDEQPLDELAASILANGLIHPPALRTSDKGLMLVAGERRIRACTKILETGRRIRCGTFTAPDGEIPYIDLGGMSDLCAFESELDENIKRKDLTWQEKARAESALLSLRQQQATITGAPAPTLASIATEVVRRRDPSTSTANNYKITAVANRIRLAEHLADPEVAKAKTEQDAVKIVKRKQEAARVESLAKAFSSETAGKSVHELRVGDMREELANIPSASVDVLLTDPPYGIGADTFGEQSGTGHEYQDSVEYFEALMSTLSEESYRVCKDQAHAYVFCDPRRFADVQTHFELAGWAVWPIPLIWAKGNGMLPRPDHAPRRTYECILFASKGDRPVRCVKGDVISVPAVRDLKHGAQKPVDLYVDLLGRSVIPGNVVLDTFAGSGTIFPAANRCKCRAIGIELNPAYANIATLRMGGEEDDIPGLEELEL